MDVIPQHSEGPGYSLEPPVMDADGRCSLCTLVHDTDERLYQVSLETDINRVSLEGMNKFLIPVVSLHKESGRVEKLYAELEINLRHAMSSVSIADGDRHYFSVTGRSLDPDSNDIDSSIHEAVDLGLVDFRIRSGAKPKACSGESSMLFDALSCNLLKGGISTLLARATISHRLVIINADHIFASRQDYIRDMCTDMARHADSMAMSITSKALHCDQGLF